MIRTRIQCQLVQVLHLTLLVLQESTYLLNTPSHAPPIEAKAHRATHAKSSYLLSSAAAPSMSTTYYLCLQFFFHLYLGLLFLLPCVFQRKHFLHILLTDFLSVGPTLSRKGILAWYVEPVLTNWSESKTISKEATTTNPLRPQRCDFTEKCRIFLGQPKSVI